MCCAIWNFIFDRKSILSIGLEFVPGLRIFEDVMFVEEASLKIKKIVQFQVKIVKKIKKIKKIIKRIIKRIKIYLF